MTVTEGFGMAKTPERESICSNSPVKNSILLFTELLFIRFMSVFCNKNTNIFKCCCNFINNIRL